MARLLAVLILMLLHSTDALAQPNVAPVEPIRTVVSPQIVYFLLDGSGSIDEAEREKIAAVVKARRDQFAIGTLTSITAFGSKENGGECGVVNVSEPTLAASSVIEILGTPGRFTPLGSALEATLREAAPRGAKVILVADGEDSCGRDVCSVVRRYKKEYPSISIEFSDVGATADVLDSRGCIVAPHTSEPDISLVQAIASGSPPPDVSISRKESQATADERFFWIVLIFLIPASALQYSMHYNKRTDLANDVNREANAYSDADLDKLSNSIRRDRIDFDGSSADNSERHFALFLAGVVLLGALVMLTSNFPYFVSARLDFWETMNSNFLSETFAATVLVMAAFAAAQWWSWLRARKDVLVTIGDVRQLHHDLVNARNRLASIENSMTAAELWISKPKPWQKARNETIASIFQPTRLALIDRATKRQAFESSYDDGSIARLREEKAYYDAEIDRLLGYQNIKDATRFGERLVKDASRLTPDQLERLNSASWLAYSGREAELREHLISLFWSDDQTPVQIAMTSHLVR
jgi:hypothetical protein